MRAVLQQQARHLDAVIGRGVEERGIPGPTVDLVGIDSDVQEHPCQPGIAPPARSDEPCRTPTITRDATCEIVDCND